MSSAATVAESVRNQGLQFLFLLGIPILKLVLIVSGIPVLKLVLIVSGIPVLELGLLLSLLFHNVTTRPFSRIPVLKKGPMVSRIDVHRQGFMVLRGLLPVGSPVNTLKAFLPSPILVAHCDLLDFIAQNLLGKVHKL